MPRRRQVRLRYPEAFVDLATLLALRHGRRRTAKSLALPLSTIYRWLDQSRQEPARLRELERGGPDTLDELMGACEAHGFDLRQRMGALEPGFSPGPAAARTAGPVESAHAPKPVLHTMEHAPAGNDSTQSRAIRARVQLARDEIEQRYYAPLSCEFLAGLAGMSRFHFIRTFKIAFSVAPYRYLMQVRIRHACQLLSTTPQPLDAVAAAVGFDSQSLLCKAFKSVEGVTLAEYFRGVRLGAARPRGAAAAHVHAAGG